VKSLFCLFILCCFVNRVWSQVPEKSQNERIKICLNALFQDQKDFFKRNGRYAAHVDQLHSSEREACYGVILSLRRNSSKEFRITGVMGELSGTINSSMKLTWNKSP
jgi:hypothetical protein